VSAASEITRKAKSNLAFALKILPRERRAEMVVFYAFCRTVDDLADDPAVPLESRAQSLDAWKHGISHGFPAPDEFQREVIALRDRLQIPNVLLLAIIEGCRMDLAPQRFATWTDLSNYIWKVACAVGLVSLKILGCQEPASEAYAVALGHGLQLTNILRDLREDMLNGGRIYLPLEDLVRYDYTQQDLAAGVSDERFTALMDFQAARADAYFQEAAATLPSGDLQKLLPARIMGEIYQSLLGDMQRDRFRVFKKRYRVPKIRKLAILSKHLIAQSCQCK
jgi:phytoene synthase